MRHGIAGVTGRYALGAHCAGGLFGWQQDRVAVARREVSELPGKWRLESDDEWGMWFEGVAGGLWYIMVFLDDRWMVVDLDTEDQAIEGPWRDTARAAWESLGQKVA